MRSVRLSLPFALLLVVCATGAFAQSLSVAPDSFYLYSSEVTMDLRAGEDFGLDHNDLVFTGPDSITMPIDAVYGSFMEVSVPTIVTFTAGTWNVQVFAYDAP